MRHNNEIHLLQYARSNAQNIKLCWHNNNMHLNINERGKLLLITEKHKRKEKKNKLVFSPTILNTINVKNIHFHSLK